MESGLLSLEVNNRKLILPSNFKILTLGRSELSNIVIEHPLTSRFHCYIDFLDQESNGDDIVLYDGNIYTGSPSFNGTYVSYNEDDFEKIPSSGAVINPGVKIRLGCEYAPIVKLDLVTDNRNSLVDKRYHEKKGYIKSLFGGIFRY